MRAFLAATFGSRDWMLRSASVSLLAFLALTFSAWRTTAQVAPPVAPPVAVPIPVVIDRPTDWPTVVGLACTAIVALVGAWNAHQARKSAELTASKTEAQNVVLQTTAEDIRRVEHATNSMQAELVKAASEQGARQGRDEERVHASAIRAAIDAGPVVPRSSEPME